METVLRAFVHMHLVTNVVGLQRRLIVGPHAVHPLICAGVIDQKRRFYFRNIPGRRSRTIKRHASIEIRAECDGQFVDHGTSPTEAGRAKTTIRKSVSFQESRAVYHVLPEFGPVERRLH